MKRTVRLYPLGFMTNSPVYSSITQCITNIHIVRTAGLVVPRIYKIVILNMNNLINQLLT